MKLKNYNKKIKAILLINVLGNCPEMEEIRNFEKIANIFN